MTSPDMGNKYVPVEDVRPLTLDPPFTPNDGLVTPIADDGRNPGPASKPVDRSPQLHTGPSTWLPIPSIDLVLPAVYHARGHGLLQIHRITDSNLGEYFASELDVTRLNSLHKHLWVAGLRRPPRPLHQQLAIGRTIGITEQADMHMLWTNSLIFMKPLPDFLLCHDVWKNYLCSRPDLYSSALGFLYSYIQLICYPSDHRIAVELGLLNKNINWKSWSSFTRGCMALGNMGDNSHLNPRYGFSELRLNRVNWAYRLCSRNRGSLNAMIRGYSYAYRDYSGFISGNLKFMATLFLYVTLVLSAMQVGLSTSYLGESPAFQGISWVFTILSIVGPLSVVALVFIYVLFLVLWNWMFTREKKGKPRPQDPCWDHAALSRYRH